MSFSEVKNWMVRTKANEILGPYSQKELWEAFTQGFFSTQDEIALSQNHWISAQVLSQYIQEEFTSTKNEGSGSVTVSVSVTATESELETETVSSKATSTPSDERKASPQLRRQENFSDNTYSEPSKSTGKWWYILGTAVVTFLVTYLFFSGNGETNKFSIHKEIQTFEDLKDSVQASIKSQSYDKALEHIGSFRQKKSAQLNPEISMLEASVYVYQNEPTKARKILDPLLLSSQPNLQFQAHFWTGFIDLQLGQEDMGENHFLAALELNPKDAASRFNLGRAFLKSGKYRQALDYLQLAELELPKFWLISIYKGRARQELGQIEQADLAFRMSIQASPDRWLPYFYYALFQFRNKEKEKAVQTLKKMLTKDSAFELLSPVPYGFFQEKINYEEYRDATQKILSKDNWEDKEVVIAYMNFLSSPEDCLSKIKNIPGETTFSKLLLLKMSYALNDDRDSIEKRLKDIPTEVGEYGAFGYLVRGKAAASLNNLSQSEKEFEKAILTDPKSAEAHWALYEVYQKREKFREAEQVKKELLSFHPDYIPALK